jgi:hypothetical protein
VRAGIKNESKTGSNEKYWRSSALSYKKKVEKNKIPETIRKSAVTMYATGAVK